jgi:hypothetical protein
VYKIHFSNIDNLGILFLRALWDTTQNKIKGSLSQGMWSHMYSWRDVQQRIDRGSMQMVLMPYHLFSWKKEKTMIRINAPAITIIKIQLDQWLLTLFAPILLHHVRIDCSSSSFSLLSPPWIGIDCLSFPLSGGQGHPHPLPPDWSHFPKIPGNIPLPCRAQYGKRLTPDNQGPRWSWLMKR